jgi:two-component system sensor histidine kinase/response regulator
LVLLGTLVSFQNSVKLDNLFRETTEVENTDMVEKSVIDEMVLKSMFGDDDEIFKEILTDFVEPCRSMIKDIQSAFEAESAQGVKFGCHKLRSAALSVGATELGELCALLEQAGMSNDWDTINAGVPKLGLLMSPVESYITKL